jgi:hypothetical protein
VIPLEQTTLLEEGRTWEMEKTCVFLFYSMVYLGHISYYSMARYVIIKRIYIYIFYGVL